MPGFPRDTAWTDAKRAKLGPMRAQGLSNTEIAHRLRVPSGSVISEVRRQGLPLRDSPIKRKAATTS